MSSGQWAEDRPEGAGSGTGIVDTSDLVETPDKWVSSVRTQETGAPPRERLREDYRGDGRDM